MYELVLFSRFRLLMILLDNEIFMKNRPEMGEIPSELNTVNHEINASLI